MAALAGGIKVMLVMTEGLQLGTCPSPVKREETVPLGGMGVFVGWALVVHGPKGRDSSTNPYIYQISE